MNPTRAVLAAMLLAAGTGGAFGQGVAGADPDQFPAIQGKVSQYSLTPRGEVDGLILDDGTRFTCRHIWVFNLSSRSSPATRSRCAG